MTPLNGGIDDVRVVRAARVKADQRREQILTAAVAEFGRHGLHGGSTTRIAQAVGMSQPNLFRLFPTKRELFIAAVERVVQQTALRMIQRGQDSSQEARAAMRDAWFEALADRDLMSMLLQGYAACQDDEIRAAMHRVTKDIFTRLEQVPGISVDAAREFFARGLFLMIAGTLQHPERPDGDNWIKHFIGKEAP